MQERTKERLVSIVIPVYNTEAYLERCLESVIAQTYTNWEGILVNDGSRDGSLALCKRYAERDSRFRVIDQANQGLSMARNAGVAISRGEYIAFLDSDDRLEPETIQVVVEAFESSADCDMVQIPVLMDAGHATERYICSGEGRLIGREALVEAFAVTRQLTWRVCDKVFRRSLIEGMSFIPKIAYEDNPYMCQVCLSARSAIMLSRGRYDYYWNSASITRAPSPQSYVDMIYVHGLIYDMLEEASASRASLANVLYIITSDTYTALRWQGASSSRVIEIGSAYLNKSGWSFLLESSVPLRRRIKMLGIKLYMMVWRVG